MKLMVCGYGGHGKDTFCEMLGMKFTSSSMVALEKVIWPFWGKDYYSSKEICFNDRRYRRNIWYNMIKEYNKKDLTRLTRDILEENDVYCGIRDRDEFLEAKRQGLFDLSIWVDASDRLPPEAIDSCTLKMSDCDIIVRNDGTLEELQEKADFIREKMVEHKPIKDEIVKWADSVFPDRTITNAIQKLVLEEIPEYLMAQDDPMELADIGILIYDIAHLAGVDLDQAMREKMAINKKRLWHVDEITGLMHHVEIDDDL